MSRQFQTTAFKWIVYVPCTVEKCKACKGKGVLDLGYRDQMQCLYCQRSKRFVDKKYQILDILKMDGTFLDETSTENLRKPFSLKDFVDVLEMTSIWHEPQLS